MTKRLILTLVMMLITLNSYAAAGFSVAENTHQPMSECHGLDCYEASEHLCEGECFEPAVHCCTPTSLSGVLLSNIVTPVTPELIVQGYATGHYLSVIPPPVYHPPRNLS